jgi:hypothetical protein
MKEKLENISFKYKVTTFTFLLFLIIGVLSPISGADWKGYIIGKEGLSSAVKNINILDGRIISGFLINFFSYNKLLFDVCFAIMISQFVKMCNDLMGTVKTRYLYLYPLIGLLLVSVFTFSYNFLSVTTTVTYTFPAIVFFLYFYLILKDEELKKASIIKLIIYALFICLSSIHFAIMFFIVNFIYFIINDKKSNRLKHFILLMIIFISLIVSLFVLDSSLFYSNMNSIKDNIPRMIENTFSNNILLLILGAIPINMFLYEKLKENTYVRVVITLFDLILVFSLSYNFFNYSPVNLNLIISKYNGIFATENWYYILYFISYIVLFILSMNYYIKNNKVKKIFNIYMIASIIMIIFSLISPIFDVGSLIIFVFSLLFITCILAKEANTKVFVKLVKAAIIVLTIYYLSMFAIIKYIDVTRTDYINEQLEYDVPIVEVKANPTYMIWRYNPVDYFQIKDFKEYYNIPSDKSIEVKYFGLFEKVEKSIKK